MENVKSWFYIDEVIKFCNYLWITVESSYGTWTLINDNDYWYLTEEDESKEYVEEFKEFAIYLLERYGYHPVS